MKFSEEGRQCEYLISAQDAEHIVVNTERFMSSFFVLPNKTPTLWPVQSIADIEEHHLATLIATSPELIIIGTGIRYQIPSPPLSKLISQSGLSCELMATGSACRSYNLLANDGRNVCLAAILQPD